MTENRRKLGTRGALTIAMAVMLFVTAISSAAPARAEEPASPHPVVAQLVDEGLKLGGGAIVKLTKPLLSPAMTGDEQRAALERLMGRRKFSLAIADKLNAPQQLNIPRDKTPVPGGLVRRLDQYFIAYADLGLMKDEGLMQEFMDQERQERGPQKFKQYVERRDANSDADSDADAASDDPEAPYVYRYRMPLLDRVMISGLIRGQSFSAPGVMIESAVSAEGLLDDADDPTVWQTMPRRARGDDDLGEPQPYRGLAGYMQVTELKFRPGAVLIECHVVLVEPTGWFDGKPLLSSKLPIVAQENMRSFRRKLAAAMEAYNRRQATAE